MNAKTLTVDDLESVWASLGQAITDAGARDRVFLAKLALLSAQAIGDRATVEWLIAIAARNL